MASSEYGGPEETEVSRIDADVYKATTNSDYVVIRRVRLLRSKFITYHNIDEGVEDNKQWILTSQCELQPRTAAEIREPSTKYVRRRGEWGISTLVKPKSIRQPVRLFMFILSWPTRWAAKGYTSFAFGFEDLEEARRWHTRLSECLETIRADKAAAAAAAAAAATTSASTPSAAPLSGATAHTQHPTSSSTSSVAPGLLQPARSGLGSLGASSGGAAAGAGGGGGRAAAAGGYGRFSVSSLAGGAAAGVGLVKMGSMGRKQRVSGDGRGASTAEPMTQSQVASPTSVSSSPYDRQRRTSASGAAKRELVYDASGAAAVAAPTVPPATTSAPVSTAAAGALRNSSSTSSFATSSAAAAAAAAAAPPPSKPAAKPPALKLQPPSLPPPPPSSSDSEGDYEDLEEGGMGAHGPTGRGSAAALAGGGGGPSRHARGTSRGDVHQTKQRWVPYKQVNGVAIYHRPQTAGDAQAGVGGEFMVSTVVRGSPRRCLTALTSNCGNTTILGPAILQEVLQRRQAVDEKEVQRIVVQAPGLTGVICAPRELVVETLFKTDDTGPTLVLMFNSCEVPARIVERKAGEQQPAAAAAAAAADEADPYKAASAGGRRSWWRRPVAARVRGGYTMAPLEECSLDNSPEALVTCIMKVDLGGVCGERSWLRLGSDLIGWTDAFLDRMLMAVTLLRDEVEQGRFVVQPLSMMASSSRVKDRDRDGVSSTADLTSLGAACRSAETAMAAAAALGGGGGGGGVRRPTRLGSTAARAASKTRSRKEGDRPSLVDGAAADGAAAAASVDAHGVAAVEGAAAAVAAPVEGVVLEGAEEGQEGRGSVGAEVEDDVADDVVSEPSPGVSPSLRRFETMEEILARMRGLSMLDPSVWDNLHQPGKDAPFKIRGPTYLKDRKKIPAGFSRFVLGSMDVIQQPPGVMHEHVARFIPAIRQSGAPFSVVVHLVIPGTPLLGIVATFVSDRHPSTMGTPPAQPMEDEHDWEPFDFVLNKYMSGSTHVRNHMLKLIPHIADGSWMIKQSVGTTPVILGKQLRTIYYETPQYIEIDIDISANNVASYVTGLVRGATRSLVIDMGFVLEGTTPWELPEALLGTLRLYNLDIRGAKLIDVSTEIPLRPTTMAPPPLELAKPSITTTATTATGVVSSATTPTGGGAPAAAVPPPPSTPGGAAMPSSGPISRISVAGASGVSVSAAAAAPVSSGSKLAGVGGSVGGGASGCAEPVRLRGSGLVGMESAPAAGSPAADSSSPNGGAGGGGGGNAAAGSSSRSASAAKTPLSTAPLRPRGVSHSGGGGGGGGGGSVGDDTTLSPPRS